VWEIVENSPWIIERYRAQTMALDYSGDTVVNSFGDLLAAAIGFYLCYRIPWKWSVGIFIAIEAVMVFCIRDNLSLNVLMLLHPVEAIKVWQTPTDIVP
jgi:hypothetical protein